MNLKRGQNTRLNLIVVQYAINDIHDLQLCDLCLRAQNFAFVSKTQTLVPAKISYLKVGCLIAT